MFSTAYKDPETGEVVCRSPYDYTPAFENLFFLHDKIPICAGDVLLHSVKYTHPALLPEKIERRDNPRRKKYWLDIIEQLPKR